MKHFLLHTRTPAGAPAGRGKRGKQGFSLIEVLFAIGMLGIGIVGVLSLFTTGISAAAWSGNMTSAAMQAQSLYTRVVGQVDINNKRMFLNRINNPENYTDADPDNEWIHVAGNVKDPIRADAETDWWWQCRVTKYAMDQDDPLDASKDANVKNANAKPYPMGLYQVAIAVYRNWKAGKEPVVVYTTFVTAGY